MTPEEENAIKLALLRQQQEARATMLSQSAMSPEQQAQYTQQAAYDPKGREAILAEQLRGGEAGMATPMPQGHMMGDIYAAPTWADSLNAAVQRGLGGYDIGQARKGMADVDVKRGEATQAAGQLALEKARAKELETLQKDYGSGLQSDRTAGQSDAKLAEQKTEFTNREAGLDRRLGLTLSAADARAAAKGGVTPHQQFMEDRADRLDATAKAAKLDENTRKLATKLVDSGIPQAEQGINTFYSRIEPYRVKDEKGQPTDQYAGIPGIGGVQNLPGMVGNAVTAASDIYNHAATGAPESAGRDVKAAYWNVLNQKIKDISGGQVTVGEWMRNQAAAGSTPWNEEMSAVEGMGEIKKALAARKATIKSGYSDPVVGNYEQHLEREGATPAAAANPASATPAGIDPAIWAHMKPEEQALFR